MISPLTQAYRSLRTNPVSVAAWQQLFSLYAQGHWPWHAQYAQTQAQRCAQAHRQTLEALPPAPGEAFWGTSSEQQLTLSTPWAGLPQVLTRLRERTEAEPEDWLSWLYLARCLEIETDPQKAEKQRPQLHQAVRRGIECEVLPGETGHLLAQWRLRSGFPAQALAALQAVLTQAPQR